MSDRKIRASFRKSSCAEAFTIPFPEKSSDRSMRMELDLTLSPLDRCLPELFLEGRVDVLGEFVSGLGQGKSGLQIPLDLDCPVIEKRARENQTDQQKTEHRAGRRRIFQQGFGVHDAAFLQESKFFHHCFEVRLGKGRRLMDGLVSHIHQIVEKALPQLS